MGVAINPVPGAQAKQALSFGTPSLRNSPVHPWNVAHACDDIHQAATTVEGQMAAGMRPVLITPNGRFGLGTSAPPAAASMNDRVSLLGAWRNLRGWRKLIHAEVAAETEIIHAYNFAPGMAAERNFPVVVYDFTALLTDSTRGLNALAQHLLRRAEIFVLTHAAAVVVHTPAARWRVLGAGARKEDIFLISAEIFDDPAQIGPAYDAVYRHALKRCSNDPRIPFVKLQPISAPL